MNNSLKSPLCWALLVCLCGSSAQAAEPESASAIARPASAIAPPRADAPPPTVATQPISAWLTPQGLTPAEWSQIQQEIEAARYQAVMSAQSPGTIGAQNPRQQLRLSFDQAGAGVTALREPRDATQELHLQTLVVRRGDRWHEAQAVEPVAEGSRIDYRRSGWNEWFVNGAGGIEHGYRFDTRPLTEPAAADSAPLRIELAVQGFQARAQGPRSLRFVDEAGHALIYDRLKVVDADGRVLPSMLAVLDTHRIEIAFDDAGARYPVLVDPMLVNPEAVMQNPGDSANLSTQWLGYSVALDGAHLLVGAPYAQGYGAVYALTRSGATYSLTQQLRPDVSGYGKAGVSVAVSGDLAVVGAPGTASAYVYAFADGQWTLQSKLTEPSGRVSDRFGQSVAIFGDTLIVGEPGYNCAHSFVRSGTQWLYQSMLTSPQNNAAGFGSAVATANNLAVIGAPGNGWGQASVFVASSGVWSAGTALKATDISANTVEFGAALALSGETIVVGAPAGNAAYVFAYNDSKWKQQAKLLAADGVTDSRFGAAVAVVANQAMVGAPGNGDAATTGAAYLFNRIGTAWVQQAKLVPANAAAGDAFGSAVAIGSGVALAGSDLDDVKKNADQGSLRIFTGSGASWYEQKPFTVQPGGSTSDHFGVAVAYASDTLLVGVPDDDIGSNQDQGSAYVYVRSGSAWLQQAKLTAADGKADGHFGGALALSGSTALIGAYNAKVSYPSQGAAYVFVRSGNTWSQQARLTASDASDNDQFGTAVSLDGDTALVAADHTTTPDQLTRGTGYVFVRSGSVWSQQARLPPPDSMAHMGCSAALSGNTVLIGSCEMLESDVEPAPVAFAFGRSGSTWSPQASISVDLAEHSSPISVALDGDTALLGYSAGNIAYIVTRSGTSWSQKAVLTVDDPDSLGFGWSVAVRGDLATIGAPYGQPAAYLFARAGDEWTKMSRLAGNGGSFGATVVLSGTTVAVGAPSENTPTGAHGGSAYVFRIGTDYGDAPAPYPTLVADDGARHFINTDGPDLGIAVDAENDGQPNSGATGDDVATGDDEDGVTLTKLVAGEKSKATVVVTAPSGTAQLDAWIDFNGDGSWSDDGEKIFSTLTVNNGSNTLKFTVPSTTVIGQTYARFRISPADSGAIKATGKVLFGEVEDYIVKIKAP